MSHVAYISLGSNVGDSAATLLAAMKDIDDAGGIEVRRISQMRRTEPVGGPEQPAFLNAVVEIETTLPPRDLLGALQRIERKHGRDRLREQRWGPRTCDLDILLIDRTVVHEQGLEVPHPRMHERRFVLEPLASIAPDAWHPVQEKTARELLDELQ